MMRRYTILGFVFAIGCGGTGPGMTGDDVQPIDAPGMTADAYIPPTGYTKLIGRSWSLQAGQTDIYRCVRVTVQQDMYVTDIQAQAPDGTHHTVLSIASGNAAGVDGEQDCSVSTLGMRMLYASGVGTSPFSFPSGVSIRIAAGTQIHLNLHLYNAGDEPLANESAIWVKSQPTPTTQLAEMQFAGPLQFSIAPGMQTVQGSCTISGGNSTFALWPHMHKLAVHQKIELIRGANAPVVLHDMPYAFGEQKYWPQTPEIQVQANDRIRVTCTYNNTTGSTIGFGDSSDDEMCFGGMYRYPSTNANLFCGF